MASAPQATLFLDVMRLKKTTPIASLLLPLRFYAAQSPSKCHPLPPTSDLAIRHRLLIPRWPKRCSTHPTPSIFLPKQLSFALLVVSFVATPSTRALPSRYRPPRPYECALLSTPVCVQFPRIECMPSLVYFVAHKSQDVLINGILV
jgi:hypothetical protein